MNIPSSICRTVCCCAYAVWVRGIRERTCMSGYLKGLDSLKARSTLHTCKVNSAYGRGFECRRAASAWHLIFCKIFIIFHFRSAAQTSRTCCIVVLNLSELICSTHFQLPILSHCLTEFFFCRAAWSRPLQPHSAPHRTRFLAERAQRPRQAADQPRPRIRPGLPQAVPEERRPGLQLRRERPRVQG